MFKLSHSKWGSAVGLTSWTSRAKLWRLMTGREVEEDNPYMINGRENEHRAVAGVEAFMGWKFDHTGKDQKRSKTRRYGNFESSAKPDGDYRGFGLEVKCPKNLKDEIRLNYQVQLCAQFDMCGFQAIYYSEWTPEEQRIWRVSRDGYLSILNEVMPYLKYFSKYVITDTEPKRFSAKANPKPSFSPLTYERVQ